MGKDCSLAVKPALNGADDPVMDVCVGTPTIPVSDNTALLSSMLSESQRKQEDLQRRTERMEDRMAYLENVVVRGQRGGS